MKAFVMKFSGIFSRRIKILIEPIPSGTPSYCRELRAMSTYGVTCVGLYFKIYKGGNLFAKLKGLKIKNP